MTSQSASPIADRLDQIRRQPLGAIRPDLANRVVRRIVPGTVVVDVAAFASSI